MKKLLPIITVIIFVFSLFIQPGAQPAFAQGAAVPTPDIAYTPDAEVNFVGKAAARSIQFLNWTLQNYYWQCFDFDVTRKACDNSQSPLIGFWATIRNIVYAFFALIVLITAFVLMTTRGKSLTIQRFLPRFVAVVLLVTFSYAMLQFIYISADVIQGFFLTKPDGRVISAEDLLFVGWDYETFIGLRKVHPFFDESVFVNLLLARMTAVTYYAITGVLLIRKIILWFFIIVSPVFPILLLYYPVRNTAKIWIGEFFRWLMYGPLFSIFLAGLVSLWQAGIPLLFDFSEVTNGRIVYPTATNILLGGPGQAVTISNNLNLPDTFAQYVVALIMLWVVLLLPFVLLQIFLDYLNNFSITESPAFQKIINTSYTLLNKPTPPPLPPGTPPSGPAGTGLAKSLPFAKYSVAQQIPDIRDTGMAREIPMGDAMGASTAMPFEAPVSQAMQSQINAQMLSTASLTLPTIRDIANYERQVISQRDTATVTKTVDALRQIANPLSIANPIERDRMVQLKETLMQQSQSGNSIASSVLSAVNTVNTVNNISNIKQASSNLKNTLTQIANPATSTSTVQRDRVTRLKDSLVKESQAGNNVATTVLSMSNVSKESSMTQVQDLREKLIQESLQNNSVATNVLASSMNNVETATLEKIVKEIANPQLASATDKERVTQMHDSLVKESEKGNEIASTILSSKEMTTTQVAEMKEKLMDASLKGNTTATSILSSAVTTTAVNNVSTATLQEVISQIANPASVTGADKEKITQLHDTLMAESEKGNEVAKTILSGKEVTSTEELQQVKEKLMDASLKGDKNATSVLATAVAKSSATQPEATPFDANLPQTNRVQAVSFEDYEAVKKMWQENYNNLEVPEGTDRKAWISNEMSSIDSIVNLLSSDDPAQVQEGMQEVSNILPFLLLGGFSKDEIVAYLKAKKEAGKSVLEVIETQEQDESTMVSVEKRHATASATQTMSASVPTSSSGSDSEDAFDEASPLQHVVTRPVTIKVNEELLKLTNLTVPTMKDVVKFELSLLSKDSTNKQEVEKVRETLQQIGNPASVGPEQQEKVQQIRQQLLQNSQQGDQFATSILQAANHVTNKSVTVAPQQIQTIKQVFNQLADPSQVADEKEREKITAVHNTLQQEKDKNNPIATSILSVNQTTSEADIEKLHQQVLQGKQQGEPAASAVTDALPTDLQVAGPLSLPQENTTQTVSLEDYEAVKQMWEENYKNVDVPTGVNNRKEWIAKDLQNIDQLITLLSSDDQQKVQEGMQEVSNILPFLLLGGFTREEIVAYLKAKMEAGKSILKIIDEDQNNEDTMVVVEKHATQIPATMTQSAQAEASDFSDQDVVFSSPHSAMTSHDELRQMTNLPLPTMRDLANFEKALLSKNSESHFEAVRVKEQLQQLANPSIIVTAPEREQIEHVKETLVQSGQKGDEYATAVLTAANQAVGSLQPVTAAGPLPERVLSSLSDYFAAIASPDAMKESLKKVIVEEVLSLHQQVLDESKRNNPIAKAILEIVPESPLPEIQELWEKILVERTKGNKLAGDILGHFPEEAKEYANPDTGQPVMLPQTNKLQTVNIDDYEAVRTMWEENYKTTDLPEDEPDRAQWVRKEKEKMEQVLQLITSNDQKKIQEGMQSVSHILPFLLLGGFSMEECVAYLKAKLQGATSVLKSLSGEEDMVSVSSEISNSTPQAMSRGIDDDKQE